MSTGRNMYVCHSSCQIKGCGLHRTQQALPDPRMQGAQCSFLSSRQGLRLQQGSHTTVASRLGFHERSLSDETYTNNRSHDVTSHVCSFLKNRTQRFSVTSRCRVTFSSRFLGWTCVSSISLDTVHPSSLHATVHT